NNATEDEPNESPTVAAQPAHAPAPVPAPAPAPVTTPPPARGSLEVTVSGSKDAAILVDGQEWGRGASIKVELEPGEHDIVVKPPGRESIAEHVTLMSGQLAKVAIVVP